jgi:DNA-binding transcriptional regulator GbsR (MarR family)
MATKGWISVHRKIQNHWVWETEKPFDKRSAWIDILLMVNHKPGKVFFNNEIVEVDTGERITSEVKLAKKWGWSRTKVRTFLKLLEQDDMIENIKENGKRTRLKVLNYSNYQGLENSKKTEKKQGENNTKTRAKQERNTNNNDNNKNNDNNDNKDKNKPSVPYQKIKKLYNEICGEELSSIRTMSDQRRKHLRARWKEEGNLNVFEYLFRKTIQSDFLTGDNDRGWQADFDWLIKNETNFNKVLEGRYDNSGKKSGQSEKDERLARIYQQYQNEEESVDVL